MRLGGWALRDHSVADIERALAAAIKDLTGVDVHVDVESLTFGGNGKANIGQMTIGPDYGFGGRRLTDDGSEKEQPATASS
jgi:hypothetical protein